MGAKAVAVSAGLAFGATTSVLNHVTVFGPAAAVVGSGAGWAVAGVVVAVIVARHHPQRHWLARSIETACFYLGACLAYYGCDWGFALPGTLRLRDDIAAGTVPDPGGTSLVPDLSEWLLWSAASIPAAVAATLLVAALRIVRAPHGEHARDGV